MNPDQIGVLLRDEHLLVLNKPAGLLVHRGPARDPQILVDLARDIAGVRVWAAHRLDRGTSGAILFALSERAVAELGRMFRSGEVEKHYLALVRGITDESGVIDHALKPEDKQGPLLPSQSDYRRLQWLGIEPREVSLVEVRPHTGRTHQVRRHMRFISHPLIGDSTYGEGRLNRAFRERWGLGRLALHAWELRLLHPVSGERLLIKAPLPADLADPLTAMGFDLSEL